MLSNNALSVFILHHHKNRLCNKNLRTIQDIIRASEPVAEKYKNICHDLPNLAILTKSAAPGEVQLTFVHATVGNMSFGGSVVAFALAGNLDLPSVVFIKMYIAFAADGDKIRLPIMEVLLCTATGDLARSKKQRDLTPCNVILLPPFLAESAILNGELDTESS